MTYKCSSRLFATAPSEVRAPTSSFAQGLRVLAANAVRLDDLDDALYECFPDQPWAGTADDLSRTLRSEWDPEEAVHALRAAAMLAIGLHRGEDIDDLINDIVGLDFLERDHATELLARLNVLHERHHARHLAEHGVLPAYDDVTFTTEVRGVMKDPQAPMFAGICSIALHLDAGPPTYFQLNGQQLQELIASLMQAADELSQLERRLADSQ